MGLGILALLYPVGFVLVPKIEMAFAFPRTGFQRMTLAAEHIFLTGAEGNRISAAWSPAGDPLSPVVLYFHGNGDVLASLDSEVLYFNTLGSSVFAPDYPGYGESSGSPTQVNVSDMAQRAFAWLTDQQKILPSRIIIVGFSIGTGPAAELALRHPQAGGLVLLSAYASLQAFAEALYGFAPQRWWFLQDTFTTLQKVGSIRVPTLVVHATADPLIPFSQGQAIFAALGTHKKQFLQLPGIQHAGVLDTGSLFEKAWHEFFVVPSKK